MDITYLGAGAVRLVGRNINVVANPYDEAAGLGKLSARADVVTLTSEAGHGEIAGAMVIDRPGEYEVKGATITGVPTRLHTDEDGQRATVFSIMVDGVNVVVSGNVAGKLADTSVEALGKVDVLVVPVGGHGLTLEPEEAAALVSQLEPSYVIPVHFDDGKAKYAVPQAGVAEFLKEMGQNPEPTTKLRVGAGQMPEEVQVVLLQA